MLINVCTRGIWGGVFKIILILTIWCVPTKNWIPYDISGFLMTAQWFLMVLIFSSYKSNCLFAIKLFEKKKINVEVVNGSPVFPWKLVKGKGWLRDGSFCLQSIASSYSSCSLHNPLKNTKSDNIWFSICLFPHWTGRSSQGMCHLLYFMYHQSIPSEKRGPIIY